MQEHGILGKRIRKLNVRVLRSGKVIYGVCLEMQLIVNQLFKKINE
jgi:hypothetical protein